jgi:hypothetical protein
MTDPILRRLTAPELLAASVRPRSTILDPILTSRTLALLYGPRGLGKTFVALGLARAAAAGESFLGWHATRPHRVIYVDGEMAADEMQQRLALYGPAPPTLEFVLADLDEGPLLDLAYVDGQRRLMRDWGHPELVVLDNLASLAGLRTGDTDRWHALQRFLLLQRQLGRAVLMVHHANKKGLQRGSSRREDVLDLVMAMRRPVGWTPGDGTRFELHFEKARSLHGRAIEPIRARLVSDGERLACQWAAGTTDPTLERGVALLEQGVGVRQMGVRLGLSRSVAYRLRDRALQLGLLQDIEMEGAMR